ncbi:MAG: hypothetical protein DRO15_07705 [Thermoprotei archaeon]|nr:MAG: hypothetical protein DRO15_07705 [Thermoprotei archaeon]
MNITKDTSSTIDITKELKLLAREHGICPLCGKETLEIAAYVYEVSLVGPILLTIASCNSCNYKFRDLIPAKSLGKKVRIVVNVKESNDLRAILYKSPTAIVKIPEEGLEITPGPAATGQITTIDGVLEGILYFLPPICEQTDNPSKCYEVVKHLQEAMEGKRSFTLVIEDPLGASFVIKSYGTKIDVSIEDI